MSRILITGATGNIGLEVIRYMLEFKSAAQIVAGVRDIKKAKKYIPENQNIEFIDFDFEKPETFNNALQNIDKVFLLRPPHISDVEKYFKPLMHSIKVNNINEVMFLSVQGAEKSSIIPHNKIEKLIRDFGLNYIFIRPGYFMQNLTTTLIDDIKKKQKIILPSGKAKFNWIDVKNIAEVCAILIERFSEFKNNSFEITGYENENFYKVAALINQVNKDPIRFVNVNPLKFYRIKKRSGFATGRIIVMLLLHFLPRFQKEPGISKFYENLTGKKPTSLKDFIKRESEKFEKL
jgi:uncharacterized protein YbjT (DUF2867 family)